MKIKARLFNKNYFISEDIYGTKIDIKDYYVISVVCKNCGSTTSIYVKKGVHVNDIISGVKCNNCEVRLEKT